MVLTMLLLIPATLSAPHLTLVHCTHCPVCPLYTFFHSLCLIFLVSTFQCRTLFLPYCFLTLSSSSLFSFHTLSLSRPFAGGDCPTHCCCLSTTSSHHLGFLVPLLLLVLSLAMWPSGYRVQHQSELLVGCILILHMFIYNHHYHYHHTVYCL